MRGGPLDVGTEVSRADGGKGKIIAVHIIKGKNKTECVYEIQVIPLMIVFLFRDDFIVPCKACKGTGVL